MYHSFEAPTTGAMANMGWVTFGDDDMELPTTPRGHVPPAQSAVAKHSFAFELPHQQSQSQHFNPNHNYSYNSRTPSPPARYDSQEAHLNQLMYGRMQNDFKPDKAPQHGRVPYTMRATSAVPRTPSRSPSPSQWDSCYAETGVHRNPTSLKFRKGLPQPKMPPGCWKGATTSTVNAMNTMPPGKWKSSKQMAQGCNQPGQQMQSDQHMWSQIVSPPAPYPANVERFQPLDCALSFGSIGHPDACGEGCKFVNRPRGCKDGAACSHCHLCPYARRRRRDINQILSA